MSETKEFSVTSCRAPILEMSELELHVRAWQSTGKSVSLCHGRFDPLHVGHVLHFEEACTLADILVVTVTADPYARTMPGRPFLAGELRAVTVAAQRSVSGVALNHAPDAVSVLERLRPDVYVKGRDYAGSSRHGYLEEVACAGRLGIRVCTTTSDKYSSTTMLRDMMEEIRKVEVAS